jgi:acetate---CoA ligase (ADP-forming)
LGNYDLRPLFSPRSIAIIGASPTAGSRGHSVLQNLIGLGFDGTIHLVNPRYADIQGYPCYPSIGALPASVDVAAICLPHTQVLDVVRECHAAGAKSAAVVASGFAEAGGEGTEIQRQLADFAIKANLPISGPNGLATFNAHDRVTYWLTVPSPLPPTGLAAVMQSGALVFAVAEVAANRGIRFGCISSTGNEAVLTAADYLDFMVDDPRIQVIALLLETINDPDHFVAAAQRAQTSGKPLVALKLGSSQRGRQSAMAHTGSLAGEDAVIDAVFRQLGVIRVGDIDELTETVGLFAQGRRPKRGLVAFSGVSGAASGMVADLAEKHGLDIPELAPETTALLEKVMPRVRILNPLDISRAGDEVGLYKACFKILAADHDCDVLALGLNVPHGSNEWGRAFYLDQAEAAVEAWHQHPNKVVVVFSYSSGSFDPVIRDLLLTEGMIPLQGVREAILALRHLVQYSKRMHSVRAANDDFEPSTIDYPLILQQLR